LAGLVGWKGWSLEGSRGLKISKAEFDSNDKKMIQKAYLKKIAYHRNFLIDGQQYSKAEFDSNDKKMIQKAYLKKIAYHRNFLIDGQQ
jgi:hypothetical protein